MKNDINENFKIISGENYMENSKDEMYRLYRLKWHGYPKNNIIPAFPLFLDIEATSACNLSCPTCIQSIENFEKRFMHWKTYEKIIDEASANGCYGCKYHTIGRGEPLLHGEIVKMVMYAKKKGLIDVYINTNATLLNKDLSNELLDAGLDRISFSVDGYTEEHYKKYRNGADVDKVKEKISYFYELRDKGSYKTKIRIQTIGFPDIEIDEYNSFWKAYCDDIAVISYKEMRVRSYGIVSDWVCPQLWQRASVLYDGTILPCNHDDRKLVALGNILESSIAKIWKGREIQYMRERHLKGESDLIAACDGCFLRDSCIQIYNRDIEDEKKN